MEGLGTLLKIGKQEAPAKGTKAAEHALAKENVTTVLLMNW